MSCFVLGESEEQQQESTSRSPFDFAQGRLYGMTTRKATANGKGNGTTTADLRYLLPTRRRLDGMARHFKSSVACQVVPSA
jgi:hypothetical protein